MELVILFWIKSNMNAQSKDFSYFEKQLA